MTYEDMHYGLVVDHTPPPRQLTCAASGGASMLVAVTKSECQDDLEDDMDGETYAIMTGNDVMRTFFWTQRTVLYSIYARSRTHRRY